ncbi:tRNA epoxyqueuosine(34) reductase QueG [Microbulbifer flavimaris]|uniref:Epoxyqueuosine reductase n=1 Tax=Microbulbifer flavimaris TaxID=1781068 RepID=A0ABX4HYJ3_9GAMM|nr:MULTISPECIES: tRNA epoxyqueuosine(34) reductase QueG [Microbulbifer]KUJ82875.1 epoxyqueuosine reductase [Microbulbifer sp. ZGT114]PCO05053.1 tRNA epoxyqueuosine(34) reductase QueG [Microbulbifer flavimaris]
MNQAALAELAALIKDWGRELGFQQIGITDCHLTEDAEHLRAWIDAGHHGDMDWMAAHGDKRWRPEKLEPGTLRVISARLDYLPPDTEPVRVLKDSSKAYVSRYATGRDYHKLIRKRLAQLGERIEHFCDERGIEVKGRAFTDSAPVMERALAQKAGLGWIGKNCMLINSGAGSWFFLGELFTSLPLPVDESDEPNQCGECSACLKVCPTDAFLGPNQLDARRCISYLTIENKGPIPEEFREPMGNRVFGCDDCQIICPWNRFAQPTAERDFHPRHGLADGDLLALFRWSEDEFLQRTAGSAIRRIGYERWQRNLAVAIGNGEPAAEAIAALESARGNATPLVAEHIHWALQRLRSGRRRRRKIRRQLNQD